MKNKKGAPTAATVQGAKTNSQGQFTPNSERKQDPPSLKYPMDAKKLLMDYVEQTGHMPDDLLSNIYTGIAKLVNQAYEDERREAIKVFEQKGRPAV